MGQGTRCSVSRAPRTQLSTVSSRLPHTELIQLCQVFLPTEPKLVKGQQDQDLL